MGSSNLSGTGTRLESHLDPFLVTDFMFVTLPVLRHQGSSERLNITVSN